jgi:site-specific DNA-cytosine methylase
MVGDLEASAIEPRNLRERVNDILLPDEDTIPDFGQIDMGNDPCCGEAREMWYNLLAQSDIQPGGESKIIEGYDAMSCEELEAALRDFAGDIPGPFYESNVTSRKPQLPPTEFHFYARQVLDQWDKCKFAGLEGKEAREMGFHASEDAFEIAWDTLLKGRDYLDPEIYSAYHNLMNRPKKQKNPHNVVGNTTFSGWGGTDVGLEMSGLEPGIGVENDPIAAERFRANFPDHELIEATLGEGEGELGHKELAGRMIDHADGRPVFLSQSAPCINSSNARPGEKDHAQTMLLQNYTFDLANELRRKLGKNQFVSAFEQTPNIKEPILASGQQKWKQPPAWVKRMVERSKPTYAADFGSAQQRNRFYGLDQLIDIERPFDEAPGQKFRSNWNTVKDFLPHMEEEEHDNFESKSDYILGLLANGVIDPKIATKLLTEPHITHHGTPFPGRGRGHTPSPWTSEKKGYSWHGTKPIDSHMSSLTSSNIPGHLGVGPLSQKDVLALGNFPMNYKLGDTTAAQSQRGIGNAVNPLVARAMADAVLGHFNRNR